MTITKIIKKCLLIGILTLFVIWNLSFGIFNVAQAQEGLVPCGTNRYPPGSTITTNGNSVDVSGQIANPCGFCDLLTLIEKIIDFALKISFSLVIIFILYGGFVIMTAGGSSERAASGRKIIQAAIIGILIALAAWLIINTILTVLTGQKFEPWKFYESINCLAT